MLFFTELNLNIFLMPGQVLLVPLPMASDPGFLEPRNPGDT